MNRPPLTLRRFLRRFWLLWRSCIVHPTTVGYLRDMPDGSIVMREFGRDRVEVRERHPWVGDLIAGAVAALLVGLMLVLPGGQR